MKAAVFKKEKLLAIEDVPEPTMADDDVLNFRVRRTHSMPPKTLFVVDVIKPATDLLMRDNVFFVGGGVSEMDTRFILSHMKP